MKKKISIVFFILAGILFLSSCGKDDIEEPTLNLSNNKLEFTKEASEKKITVTTNKVGWSASANAEWVKLAPSGNTLTIKVTENKSTTDREAQISVLAGGIGQLIDVKQSSSDVIIELIPDTLDIDQFGGERIFDVKSNTLDWDVISDAEWVSVIPKQILGEVRLNIASNSEREARTAKLTLTAGETTKEFVINQSGIMYYILPLLKRGAHSKEIKAFEKARNSTITSDYSFALDVETQSEIFYKIKYNLSSSKLKDVNMLALDEEALKDAAFHQFMLDNNFVLETDEETLKLYTQEAEKIIIEARVTLNGADSEIKFEFTPKQTQDYPTFATFPYWFLKFDAGTPQEAMDLEAVNGGTLADDINQEESRFLFYNVSPSDTIIHRSYWFTLNEPQLLEENAQFYKIPELAFFTDETDQLYITKEFKALLAAEGFVYYNLNKGTYFYYKSSEQLVLAFSAKAYTDIGDGEIVLSLHLFKRDLSTESSVDTPLETKKIPSELKQ